MFMEKRYTDFNTYLRSIFGCRVQKITLDAGLGCPNRDGTISYAGCVYCNQKGSGTGAHALGKSIEQQATEARQALARRYKAKKFIAYFQSYTNTYAQASKLKELYDRALGIDGMVGLSVGTRPDCVDDEKLDLLAGYQDRFPVWVEYGLQSAHDATLRLINRGHDFAAFEKAVEASRKRGLKVCTHVILGLPGESREQMMETAETLSKMDINGIKIHLLYVVKETVLERWYQQGGYACLTRDEYADLVCGFLARLRKDIVIQRLTGDPGPDELIAPQWARNKSGTLEKIQKTMEESELYQGSLL
ncbi:MAG: TIGR01212 family radical SAM protein [Desulfobacteraceae bacterium]|nr:TIGR01212 family radical SAM protein [Desulfobacteraceae bacterium]